MKLKRQILHITILIVVLMAGSNCTNPGAEKLHFQLHKKSRTGLDFENVLKQDTLFNVFSYMYFFNGGGVATGDFNQDGWQDLYFTSNMGMNKLFLNEQDFRFRDVTDAAGVAGAAGWTSGVSIVDINNDGLLDIYVSQVGDYLIIKGKNQLYVCQGIENGVPQFEDKAADYGLDLVGFSTQTSFFDYDLDGDLDMYLLNHSLHQNGTFGQKKSFIGTQHPTSGDKLMRNDNGQFKEVTLEAGINSTVIGYGLGIATGDINLDGWPDIYIGNDFHENDYLYINQQDGTFKEVLTEQIRHTSRFSMGVDIADINNDGWSEVVSLDMLPDDPFILKSSLGEDQYSIFKFKLGYGYNHQFARNNLQLNRGNGTFQEIGTYAGIHATDWSWAPLLIDFDHDGYRDLFISNGIPRRMNDIDYVKFRKGDEDMKWKTLNNYLKQEELAIVEKMPRIKLPNRFFRNNGDLTFTDWAEKIAENENTFSNGAAYADLDKDGDLDIIVNNIEDAPFIYENLLIQRGHTEQGNYLNIQLVGSPQNKRAIGAKAVVFKSGKQIIAENFPVRGYQSAVQIGLHLGLGDTTDIDSIIVIWPDQTWQQLESVAFNKTIVLRWQTGLPLFDYASLQKGFHKPFQLVDATDEVGLDFVHDENPFVEFNRERLIPHMVSSEGPALAVGDVNGDGLEDVFLGSSKRQKSALYFQNKQGKFYNATPEAISIDSIFEDVGAVFADIENDNDLDLIIATGGNEYYGQSPYLTPRTYLNDGKGNFKREEILPRRHLTASCVLPADFNQDGFIDFFFGGRAVPWNYGKTPNSYLFENQGDGTFLDATLKYSEDLGKTGLVKDGNWADIDADNDLDLILAVEWQPIQVYLNQGSHFEKKELLDLKGWWNFVLPYDFDQDGDIDILAGNLGENSKLRPTKEKPVKLYIEDFDDNQQIEQILTYHLGDKEVPFANYEELTTQLVSLKKKYLYAQDLAKATLPELFGEQKLASAEILEANYLKSAYFENRGNFEFKVHALPPELQFSTLESAWVYDLNKDGKEEILLGGNFYECNIEMGRYDANYGNILSIWEEGKMQVFPMGDLNIKGQVRRIKPVLIGEETYFILAKNEGKVQLIRPVLETS